MPEYLVVTSSLAADRLWSRSLIQNSIFTETIFHLKHMSAKFHQLLSSVMLVLNIRRCIGIVKFFCNHLEPNQFSQSIHGQCSILVINVSSRNRNLSSIRKDYSWERSERLVISCRNAITGYTISLPVRNHARAAEWLNSACQYAQPWSNHQSVKVHLPTSCNNIIWNLK